MDEVPYFQKSIFLRFFTGLLLIKVSQCSDSDVNALLAIKQQLNGQALKDWIGNNPCNWTGIGCGSSNNVVNLSLPMMNLTGPLAPSIGNLSSLTTINLAQNFFSGPIPSELSNCSALQFLDLSGNDFSGGFQFLFDLKDLTALFLANNNLKDSIPLNIGSLGNLRFLNLSRNFHLAGAIPDEIGNCTSLEIVDLSLNNFSGSIPPSVFHLKQLQVLYLSRNNLNGDLGFVNSTAFDLEYLCLSNNKLSGGIPGFIFTLSELIVLRLSGNNLTGFIPPSLANLTKLELLYLSNNDLSGQIPTELGKLSALTELSVRHNKLTGSIPRELFYCGNLTSLSLAHNRLSSSIPQEMGDLSLLRYLHLNHNQLSSAIPLEIGKLVFLAHVQLNHNNLTGSIPAELGNCTSLSHLDFSMNHISGEIPQELGMIPDLSRLHLERNQLSGSIPSQVTALISLEYIVLSHNSISGSIPDNFSDSSQLLNLELKDNQLTGPLPTSINTLRRLQLIDVSKNQLTGNLAEFSKNTAVSQLQSLLLYENNISGALPTNWICMRSLLVLDFHGNMFSGNIPREIGSLYQVTSIDFSSNSLYGTIPSEIGNYPYLVSLNLSFNSLTGDIPKGMDRSWQQNNDLVVDLSSNHLTGNIPVSFNLSNLKLNVSDNDLSGSIPTLLQTLSADNFKGNSHLCGPPLSNSCVQSPSSTGSRSFRFIVLGVVLVCVTAGTLLFLVVWFKMAVVKEAVTQGCTDVQAEVNGSDKPSTTREFFNATLFGETCLNATSDSGKHAKLSLSFSDLSLATGGFRLENVIGDGGFGKVYKGVLADGTIVAIKKLTEDGYQGEREFIAELQTLGNIKHNNLVRLLGFCSNNRERLLMYEYMPNNSLDLWLYSRTEGMDPLPWQLRMSIAKDVARGLTFLHHFCIPKVIHRDLKASNILLDAQFNARLADFGLARHLNTYDSHISTAVAGSLGYIAPEYAQSWKVTIRGDVFSFGVVLLELLSGKRPAGGTFKPIHGGNLVGWAQYLLCHKQILSSFFDPILGCVKGSDHEAKLMTTLEVALRCTQDDPNKRPPMLEVLRTLESLV